MERDINRQQAESLVREISQERERFLSAWEEGALSPELNQIRNNIKQLNELLWETSAQHTGSNDTNYRGDENPRDSHNQKSRNNNQP